LTSRTDLVPEAGPPASVAPARFALPGRDMGTCAYKTRYLDGLLAPAVLVDLSSRNLTVWKMRFRWVTGLLMCPAS
jgi:CRISPR-associated protein Csb1